MSLAVYRRKRRFRRTPEPRGAAPRRRATGLAFYVQKHAASHLHYDFRLELHGVLLSWAVPKGPSLDPARRRLAVHVEDHPLEYGTFEGEIPKGEYGGGTVLLWDRGEWLPEGDPEAGFEKGHLKFRLEGRKLRGGWALVRMGGRAGADGKNWLLIKENDEEARPRADILEERPESVAGSARARRHGGRSTAKAEPPFVEPQLATLAARVPGGGDWIHEIKLDGYRILAGVAGGKATLRSRHGNGWTARFRPTAEALGGLAARRALLDGELVALDEKGRTDFQELQNALSARDPDRLVYFAFDLLELDGRDLRDAPLLERKKALKKLLDESVRRAGKDFGSRVRYADHVDGQGEAFFRRACESALEGVVSKRKDAPYRSGRSDAWTKVKCLQEQEFVVAGYTEPAGSREKFGALILGVHEDGHGRRDGLRFVGRVGTGFTLSSLRELHRKLAALETPRSAFAEPPAGPAARGVHWVRPELVAEVAFSEWTRDGLLRQPSFKGLREDKTASEVTRERPASNPGDSGAKLTHPDRVLYPEQGLMKRDLAEYYAAVAGRLLPHVARRPLSLLRCPNGVGKPCFYQKHSAEFPAAVRSIAIAEKDLGRKDYLYIEDAAGLAALAQAGVLEIHPWSARVGDLERPDSLTFDLDPAPGTPWPRVLAAAREIRDRFAALKREAFVKTTGGKGLHVVVPLEPAAGWAAVKAFAKAFAELMAADAPRLYTAKAAKAARAGRIYVDYLRNERGQTAVAAYSPRALDGAPISAPVDWSELKPSLKSDRFTLLNFSRRLSSGRDPWKEFDAARRPLPALR
jgi:bifunctional non-homologous end joining protein LigD